MFTDHLDEHVPQFMTRYDVPVLARPAPVTAELPTGS
jgi:hypothetical protein